MDMIAVLCVFVVILMYLNTICFRRHLQDIETEVCNFSPPLMCAADVTEVAAEVERTCSPQIFDFFKPRKD